LDLSNEVSRGGQPSKNLLYNALFVRERTGFQLGVDQLVILKDFKAAVSKGEEFQRLEALFAVQ
jgi:hypothetical protein